MSSLPLRASLLGIGLPAALLLVASLVPIALPANYHAFADRSTLGALHHFGDTVSNLAFLASAAFVWRRAENPHEVLLACALALTCAGSWFYHLAPTDARLLIDRLPMAPAFAAMGACALFPDDSRRAMAFTEVFSIVFALAAVVALAFGTMSYWVAAQVYVILLAVAALADPGLRKAAIAAIVLYVAAKAAETFDHQILALTHIVSGHTIKHLLAALAPVLWFALREPVPAAADERNLLSLLRNLS